MLLPVSSNVLMQYQIHDFAWHVPVIPDLALFEREYRSDKQCVDDLG